MNFDKNSIGGRVIRRTACRQSFSHVNVRWFVAYRLKFGISFCFFHSRCYCTIGDWLSVGTVAMAILE